MTLDPHSVAWVLGTPSEDHGKIILLKKNVYFWRYSNFDEPTDLSPPSSSTALRNKVLKKVGLTSKCDFPVLCIWHCAPLFLKYIVTYTNNEAGFQKTEDIIFRILRFPKDTTRVWVKIFDLRRGFWNKDGQGQGQCAAGAPG